MHHFPLFAVCVFSTWDSAQSSCLPPIQQLQPASVRTSSLVVFATYMTWHDMYSDSSSSVERCHLFMALCGVGSHHAYRLFNTVCDSFGCSRNSRQTKWKQTRRRPLYNLSVYAISSIKSGAPGAERTKLVLLNVCMCPLERKTEPKPFKSNSHV